MRSLSDDRYRRPPLILVAALLLTGCASSEAPEARDAGVAHATAQVLAENVYFGDLHVHSAFSPDAYIQGTRVSPDDAYRYAKGEAIDHVSGRPIQAQRPLDFLAVTDHAEYLGLQEGLFASVAADAPNAAAAAHSGTLPRVFVLMATSMRSGRPHPEWVDVDASTRAWQEIIAAADRHDAPGRFSTLVGFEWSSTPDGRNLHRNVIFGPGDVYPRVPYSLFDSFDPEGLWQWMDEQRARGSQLLAIPHNSNLSDGTMFSRNDSGGRPIDAAYATARARNEPLVEVTQIKGTSETDPVLSPQDEFADFEIWATKVGVDGEDRDVKSAGSYARDALKTGLELNATQGVNPYRFGLIGSTDSHSASSPVEENNYSGKGIQDTTARMRLVTSPIRESVQSWSASGLAAVWAEENSRAAIYAALERKETYATTGPRISLRFFGGWRYDDALLETPGWVPRAYADGVAMGGDLPARGASGAAPRFLIAALKDPEGANLERLQVVKGWLEDGAAREVVFDVALSPRTGAVELATTWSDPAFDPGVEAFYYVRVLQKPTPRWSTHDAQRLGVDPPADQPVEIQERAFSSPIWYTPRG